MRRAGHARCLHGSEEGHGSSSFEQEFAAFAECQLGQQSQSAAVAFVGPLYGFRLLSDAVGGWF